MTQTKIRIAAVQCDIQWGQIDANLKQLSSAAQTAAKAGAKLVGFPECALSGYCFESLEEALPFALTADSPPLDRLSALAQELNCFLVLGFLERDGNQLRNSAVCLGPQRFRKVYRKIHLPFIGVDRFTTPGDHLDVFDLPGLDLRIGLNVCYDCSFPEAARVMMLDGVDLIVLPTNWPPTSGLTADLIPNARALENNVYLMAINRVGTERGFQFIGKSKICNPRGAAEAFADHAQPEILYAEIDPTWARRKHLVNIPGQHEVDRLCDREPACYRRLTDPLPADPQSDCR